MIEIGKVSIGKMVYTDYNRGVIKKIVARNENTTRVTDYVNEPEDLPNNTLVVLDASDPNEED